MAKSGGNQFNRGYHQGKKKRTDSHFKGERTGGRQGEAIFEKKKEFFLNPYNFVDVSGPTPKYSFKNNEMFHPNLNSGYIDVDVEVVTPLFIPDPAKPIKDKDGKPVDHKEMKFFKLNGKPAIPSTSLKGMLRSTIETLSNSCFPHDYKRNEALNFMSHRLDVEKDSKNIRFLKAGILKRYEAKWYFVELDMMRVLTVADRFTGNDEDKTNYEKTIYFARNKKGEIEKISVNTNTGGIWGYIERKKKSRAFDDPIPIKELKKDDFQIKEINGQKINDTINWFNKTFPYINLRKGYGLSPLFYGIVRKKKEKWGPLYKLKEISLDLKALKKRLQEYRDKNQNQDVDGAEYDICQMYLKTSYDIDTKTQDRLFFKFGVDNLENHVKKELKFGSPHKLEERNIRQLKSVLSQRYENIKKIAEKDYLLKLQPTSKHVRDGMLVYYHPKEDSYLTYTQVARKPYKYGIAEILENMGKSVCSHENALCPACNMFGGVNIGKVSIGGKVSVGFGEFSGDYDLEGDVTLKPLGEPKPSYYQFYVLDNRKNENGSGKSTSYDHLDIKLGRKVYLKHKKDELDYRDDEPSKLNSTVQLLKPGAVFRFRVSYFNLSRYELGLLLNSLDIKYNGVPLDYQMGMGKPLGLGQVKITGLDITKIDRQKRYSSLTVNGEGPMSNEEKEKFINIFQRYQVELNRGVPFGEIHLDDRPIDEYKIESVPDFETLSYIKDFKLLKSINNGIPLPYPVRYPMKRDKNEKDEKKKKKGLGFKWFMDEKTFAEQRLFEPSMLAKKGDENIVKEIPLFNRGQEGKK